MSTSPVFAYDVFLSHNSKDKARVRPLAERLRKEGLRVWFDEWVIRPGDDIYLVIERGLAMTRVQLLCLTPAALSSDWVALERSTVLFRDPTNADRRFIPLLLADCELPDTLRRYKYVDYREEAESALRELVTACRVSTDDDPAVPSPVPQSPTGPKWIAKFFGRKDSTEPFPQQRTSKSAPISGKSPVAPPAEPTNELATPEHTLAGHTGWINSVVVSPDGKWLASGSDDTTVKIWNLETGDYRATLKGHTEAVTSVAIAPDGKSILSGSFDTMIRTWRAADGQPLTRWNTGTRVLSLVAMSDGKRVLSSGAGRDAVVALWDVATQKCLATFGGHTGPVNSVSLASDQRRAVSASSDRTVRLWNTETGECLKILTGHSSTVHSAQITPDGCFAVSGSEDMTVKVWNLETGTCVGTLEGHKSRVTSVAISSDATLIASAGFEDGTLRLWDLKSGVCVQRIKIDSPTPFMSVAFSPDGSRLVAGGATPPSIYVYRVSDVRPVLPAKVVRRYVNAKVVLLGEGTVGKTSLAHRLIEDRYVVRDRTHGMNVWPLELPLPDDATLEREALLWDLAGQEDYRLIHQLFLEETALALLLINPQKDDPFAEAGDWLKSLKTAASSPEAKRDVARLLIFSQIDAGGMKLGNAKIERFREQQGFAAWLPTSAKTGENCSDKENGGRPSKLKQLIVDSIPWDLLPWTSTPRLLAELKNAVMTMRDKTDIRLLRFAELTQRLEQALPGEKFGESDVRTAVMLLANHGMARPLKFGDLVLLRPDLLNGYAGAIIRAARAHTDEIGCVLEAKIYEPDFDFTGVERLKHRPDEELLLRALVQTFLDKSLCIAEDTPHGRHLVFPSQYRREKDKPNDPDIFVSYTFGGEWQTVWTTLVVRLWYSEEFEHRELWRNAAEFASQKGHTLGLLLKKIGDGEATISLFFDVQVPEELKVIFIEYIHRHLARYACDVVRDRRYVCPGCGKPMKDLDAVRKRLEAKKAFITCQECDEKVPLIDFIEQRLTSDPVAHKILAMDVTTTRALDTQALEQILIGHMMAICGEANQIFRPVTMFDHGIDGEVEFKDNDGRACGKKIYVQLKSGDSYLRNRKRDGFEVFDVKEDRHLDYWVSQPVDVYLVIRQKDEKSGVEIIRWMNVTRYLNNRSDQTSRQIIFEGEKLDMEAVWRVRDEFYSPKRKSA